MVQVGLVQIQHVKSKHCSQLGSAYLIIECSVFEQFGEVVAWEAVGWARRHHQLLSSWWGVPRHDGLATLQVVAAAATPKDQSQFKNTSRV